MKMRNIHLKAYEGMKTEEEWVEKIKIACFASSNHDGCIDMAVLESFGLEAWLA